MSKEEIKKEEIERSPVIVVMGHIDHGKSTLLDYIRETNTVAGEAGAITQHVSAYEVLHKNKEGQEKRITFIDTPGHSAFSAMRARGASIADIAILIISAEDGVKSQTIEVYKNIKKAGIPLVVAINKIDKPNANVEKVKNELIENEIYLEGYGGDTPFVLISAKTGEGVPEILDMLLLISEMEEYKGNPNILGEGIVLESKMDSKEGIKTTVIVKNGVLKKGTYLVVNNKISSVRDLQDFQGKSVNEIIFSSPARILGCCEVPDSGLPFKTYATKKEAEQNLEETKTNIGEAILVDNSNSGEDFANVFIIIKADVFGTIEAVKKEIAKIKTERVVIRVISEGVGDIIENDIKTAAYTENVLVVGFNIKINPKIKLLADQLGVKVASFDIIYKLTEWVEEEVVKLIPKIEVEEIVGRAKVLAIFNKDKNEQIVGGKVKEGRIKLGSKVKIMRRDFEIDKGMVTNLQSQKIKTTEVKEGEEFGIGIKTKKENIAIGDYIEATELVEK